MTLDDILALHGLEWWCQFFGWQGGTIHQAKDALREFYRKRAIFERMIDGKPILCGFTF